MKRPRVSAIIPVYNGGSFLLEAVESIYKQNYDPLEIIVIDDGSTDNTTEIAEGIRGDVRYIYQPNSGPAAARNRGLRLAHGDFIGFLDVDDLWSENKISLQLGQLEKEPSLEIVLGLTQRLQMIGLENGKLQFRKGAEPEFALHLGSALFKRSAFEKVGLFDDSLEYCEDWDWFMRAKELKVPMRAHKEIVYYYRRHDLNITNDRKKNLQFALRVLRESLRRRRQQGAGVVAGLPALSDCMKGPGATSHERKEARRKTAGVAEPLVSIIIPAFNRELYLSQTIESVLSQTYCPIEIIVVDDGSTDNTAEVAKGFLDKVRYFYQPNRGCGAARNTGALKARGSFLAFLDSDDVWMEEKLSRQVEVLRSGGDVDMVFGHVEHFYSPDLDQSSRERLGCPAESMPGYIASTLLISREAFLRAGLFDTRFEVGEFLDWYGRARDKGLKDMMLQEVVSRRRIHASNTVTRKRDSQTDYIRVLKTALDRRRKDG